MAIAEHMPDLMAITAKFRSPHLTTPIPVNLVSTTKMIQVPMQATQHNPWNLQTHLRAYRNPLNA